MILGPSKSADHQPLATNTSQSTYLMNLLGVNSTSPLMKAKSPLFNHPWFYAAAMVKAVNLAQAPLYVWKETDESLKSREMNARKRGHKWLGPQSGKRRTGYDRIFSRAANPNRFLGTKVKGVEVYYEHPLSMLLMNPNTLMSQTDLVHITSLFLSIRGAAVWVKVGPNGTPYDSGVPDEIWPVDPDCLTPRLVNNRLVGWKYRAVRGVPITDSEHANNIQLSLDEVIIFRYPNPFDYFKGLAPLTALVGGVEMDMLTDAHNRAVLVNGGDPGGILTFNGELNDEQMEKSREAWNRRHSGPTNVNRTAILEGEWSYTQIGSPPKDMDYSGSKTYNRDSIFGALRTPKTTVGITEALNYATQLGQDKNLWDKSLLPDVKLIERQLERHLFYEIPDDIVGAFDLSNIEALREGQSIQIDQAIKLTGPGIHMSPRVAMEYVGLTDIPEYPGVDTAFINPLGNAPVQDVLDGVFDDPFTEPEEPEEDTSDPVQEAILALQSTKVTRIADSIKRWRNFIRAQSIIENAQRRQWRGWVSQMRRDQLMKLDRFENKLGMFKEGETLVDSILLDLGDMQNAILKKFRPTYEAALNSTFQLIQTEIGGIPVFELDDPKILQAMTRRQATLKGASPVTTRAKVQKTLFEGLQGGETFGQLRQRVSEVFKFQASPFKTLQVARTESAGLMNDFRYQMFGLQQVAKLDWITAGDENVRVTHRFFGGVEPQEPGTNYLELDGYNGEGEGSLEYPGDSNASTGEIISCRCVQVAV